MAKKKSAVPKKKEAGTASSAPAAPSAPSRVNRMNVAAALLGVVAACGYARFRASDTPTTRRWPVACERCDRVVVDRWATREETAAIKRIAVKGMDAARAQASAGGPTIFDINSGYVLAPGARLSNLHEARPGLFGAVEYAVYGALIGRLKREVERTLKPPAPLYFTAPTFVTRLSGENASWVPAADHDEYYTRHVDRDNTDHYEYSGLLYLSDHGTDFEGGLFTFFDPDQALAPRAGTLLLFASSNENPHRVHQVTAGQRFVLSFWFTCDPAYEFKDFLDGKAHVRYGEDKRPPS